jgi:protein Mpv17
MWLSNSPWCLMWDAYCNVLTTRPVATKLATGMVGTFLGDMVAQFSQNLLNTHASVTARSKSNNQSSGSSAGRGSSPVASSAARGFELDLARTTRLMGFSALVGTPVAFVWFSLLDQVCAGMRRDCVEV